MNKKRLISIIVAFVILVGVGVFLVLSNSENKPVPELGENTEGTTSDAVETFVPLDEMDLPEIAMVINGLEISRDQLLRDYSQMKILYESIGVDIKDPEALSFMKEALLSDLISTTLLAQEADRVGIKVDDAQLVAELELAVGQFDSPDEFQAMLKKMSMTEDQFREKLRRQLRISTLMKDRVDEMVDSADGLQFTEEEKKHMYTIIDAQLGGLPSYEDAEKTVDEMLEYSKVQVILGSYIQSLIESAEIDVRF